MQRILSGGNIIPPHPPTSINSLNNMSKYGGVGGGSGDAYTGGGDVDMSSQGKDGKSGKGGLVRIVEREDGGGGSGKTNIDKHHSNKDNSNKDNSIKEGARINDTYMKDNKEGASSKGIKETDVCAVLHANQFFGETALLGNGRRSASIFARTHATLLSMKKPAFLRLMELLEDPSAYD